MPETIVCVDCTAPFEFTDGESAFYHGKGLRKPRRCKSCRAKKKIARAERDLSQQPKIDPLTGFSEGDI